MDSLFTTLVPALAAFRTFSYQRNNFDWLFSNRVLCTRLQPQRLKHWRAYVFSAYGRKSKPPALRVVVDS
jgi:hypothetical protein